MTKLNQFLIYDELPLWSAPFGLILLDMIRIRKNMNILDIGSGGGFPMLEIAERAGSSCKVSGIDPSPDSVEMIRKKIGLKQITNAEIFQEHAEKIPFPDNHFHLVVANNGLNNVADVSQVLAECFRVCKKGAQVVLTMNLPHTMIEFYDQLERIFTEKEDFQAIDQMHKHIHEKRKSVEFWKNQFLNAGFLVHDVIIDGFKMHYSNGSAFLNHYFIKTAFQPSWEQFATESDLAEAEKRMNGMASDSGEFNISIPFVCFDLRKPER
jgi:arsenite methyltransferase